VWCTRAITIDAPPEQVWPWLVQMGILRAGFSTHDWLERLLFSSAPGTSRAGIRPPASVRGCKTSSPATRST
jgi:hypothetical protein